MFLSILESGRHKLLNAHDLILVTPSVGGRHYQHMGPSTTLGSLGPSHLWRHKSWVSLWGPPCAHGVASTPHGEVHNTHPHTKNKWNHWDWFPFLFFDSLEIHYGVMDTSLLVVHNWKSRWAQDDRELEIAQIFSFHDGEACIHSFLGIKLATSN